jgi:hypothetical protein
VPIDLEEWVAEATTGADQKGACQVGTCRSPDTIAVSFDDQHLVADAGLILAATLAEGLLLRELFDEGVDLGDAPGAANVGEKAMTLVHSALAGGTWIGDADWLRAGATGQVLGPPGGCILHAGHVLALVHLGHGPSARPGRRRALTPNSR